MHMKINKLFAIVSIFLLVMAAASGASAVTMTVGTGSGAANATVAIPITVDVPNTIAGAAFTITYDSTKITLTGVQSTFFDTFANQWTALGLTPPTVDDMTVNGILYEQPLLENEIATGTMVAAARCTPAPAGNSTLFTLSFVLNAGARSGTYPVGIASSVIINTAAGYNAAGETIPMLIGADASKVPTDPLAYPVLLDPPSSIGTVVAGSVTFIGLDTDSDGIADDWEMDYFGNLTTANAATDYDHDGYSDLIEYTHGTDPKVMDPAGGTGYDPSTDWRLTAQTVTLNAGWNWVSFNKFPADRSLQGFFGNNLQYVQVVKNQTQTATRVGENWIGNLTNMDSIATCTMFKIKVTQGFALIVSGDYVPLTTTRVLNAGWSWIGYLPTDAIAWNTALDSIYNNLLVVKSQTQTKTYTNGNWLGNMTTMEPGKGYAVKLSTQSTLDYPGN
jgi:hypothetical protein